ncbi:hypothetical protein ABZN20_06565 [Methylococcus sp. ANG]|uniref:hypothetical protein n=1 Tax=unclassified Methylococcus TaxID=2618889 RepID=UPI001C5284D6|nr:hypothetical protein [Methylococcus sp. Mc7]QXP84153.1 hypothetical protein KW115_18935 [Methylococcus sp. Mc7]
MIGGIVAILIAIWFYRSAEGRGLPAVQWAFAGLLAYYVPNFVWSLVVAKPLMAEFHARSAVMMAGLVGHSSVVVGAVVAIAVRHYFLLRAPTNG